CPHLILSTRLVVLPRLSSTPFPYTTLFRSPGEPGARAAVRAVEDAAQAMDRKAGITLIKPFRIVLYNSLAEYRTMRNGLMRVMRSEEHTSELQSPDHVVCRPLLEKTTHTKT